MTKKNRRAKARRALLTLSLVLVVAFAAVGGTIAWLTADGGTVTNTFTAGDINIELWESKYMPDATTDAGKLDETQQVKENKDYTIVPAVDIPKDPYVIVKEDSEACWLFVKVEETNWHNSLTYDFDKETVQSGTTMAWAELDSVTNATVYYTKVNATDADVTINILKDKLVYVSDDLTKKQIDEELTTSPVLTFTAYACQQAGVETAEEAWTYVNNGGVTPTT